MTIKQYIETHFSFKTAIIIFLSLVICSGTASIIVVYANINVAKRELVQEVKSLGGVIANSLSAAMAFNDDRYAREIIGSFKSYGSIDYICVYTEGGDLFAYSNTDSTVCTNIRQQSGLTETTLIKQKIREKDLLLGSLLVAVNAARINELNDSLIITSLLIVLGLTVLVVFPVTFLSQKMIVKPVNQLMYSTQTLLPEEKFGQTIDMTTARRAIMLAKLRIDELVAINQTFQAGIERIDTNIQTSNELLKADLDNNLRLSRLNQKMVDNPKFNVEVAREVINTTTNEIEETSKHLKRLADFCAEQKNYVSEASYIDIEETFKSEYRNHYSQLIGRGQKIKLASADDKSYYRTINCYATPLQKLFQSFFLLCDILINADHDADIHMNIKYFNDFSVAQIDMMLSSDETMFNAEFDTIDLTDLEEMYTSAGIDKLRVDYEQEKSMSSVLEMMKLYANLNAKEQASLSLHIESKLIVVSTVVYEVANA